MSLVPIAYPAANGRAPSLANTSSASATMESSSGCFRRRMNGWRMQHVRHATTGGSSRAGGISELLHDGRVTFTNAGILRLPSRGVQPGVRDALRSRQRLTEGTGEEAHPAWKKSRWRRADHRRQNVRVLASGHRRIVDDVVDARGRREHGNHGAGSVTVRDE